MKTFRPYAPDQMLLLPPSIEEWLPEHHLARFVLRGSEWDDPAIVRAMRGGREQFVALPAPVPLRIAYFTTWVGADGVVVFAPDVYRHDVAQAGLLERPRPAATLTASAR